MQMRDRQRGAAEMQRERGDARKDPEPSRGLLLVEVRHQLSATHSASSEADSDPREETASRTKSCKSDRADHFLGARIWRRRLRADRFRHAFQRYQLDLRIT